MFLGYDDNIKDIFARILLGHLDIQDTTHENSARIWKHPTSRDITGVRPI